MRRPRPAALAVSVSAAGIVLGGDLLPPAPSRSASCACAGPRDTASMDPTVQQYVEAIRPEHRPLFDRVHALVLRAFPDADVRLSYGMPTYVVGGRRLHVGTWQHGVSLYGWRDDADGGLLARHPGLRSAKGTIRLRPQDAESVTDDDLLGLVRGTLGG
jgi:uncharacterized protein YdhG (YjbR/CyaY superfamily)